MANNPGAGNTWRVGAGLRQFAFCKLRYSDKFLFRDLTMASLLLSLTLAKVICEVNSERQVFDTNNNRNKASTELFLLFFKNYYSFYYYDQNRCIGYINDIKAAIGNTFIISIPKLMTITVLCYIYVRIPTTTDTNEILNK